jgi:hypothetical protein
MARTTQHRIVVVVRVERALDPPVVVQTTIVGGLGLEARSLLDTSLLGNVNRRVGLLLAEVGQLAARAGCERGPKAHALGQTRCEDFLAHAVRGLVELGHGSAGQAQDVVHGEDVWEGHAHTVSRGWHVRLTGGGERAAFLFDGRHRAESEEVVRGHSGTGHNDWRHGVLFIVVVVVVVHRRHRRHRQHHRQRHRQRHHRRHHRFHGHHHGCPDRRVPALGVVDRCLVLHDLG